MEVEGLWGCLLKEKGCRGSVTAWKQLLALPVTVPAAQGCPCHPVSGANTEW